MSHAPRIVVPARLTSTLLLALAASFAVAQDDPPPAATVSAAASEPSTATQEPALARTADDSTLAWGPCPAFLPKGCALAVLHGDPAKDNVDVFLKVPGKSRVPMHWHTSAERMILVAGELHVTYEGQELAVLKPGTYGYGPAKRPHEAECVSADPCVLFIAFESPLDAVPLEPSKP